MLFLLDSFSLFIAWCINQRLLIYLCDMYTSDRLSIIVSMNQLTVRWALESNIEENTKNKTCVFSLILNAVSHLFKGDEGKATSHLNRSLVINCMDNVRVITNQVLIFQVRPILFQTHFSKMLDTRCSIQKLCHLFFLRMLALDTFLSANIWLFSALVTYEKWHLHVVHSPTGHCTLDFWWKHW